MGKRITVEPIKCSLLDLIDISFSDIGTLAEEMREAFENTPESLQSSSVGEARGAAADELEQYVDAPDVPDFMQNSEVTYLPLPAKRRGHSRSARCGQATYQLGVAVEECERVIETFEEQLADEKLSDEQSEKLEDQKGDVETLRDELQSAIDGCESVEFPGMYG